MATTPRACDIKDCQRPHYGLGYCRMHYKRLKKHGDPTKALRTFTGRTKDRHGYILVKVGRDHPMADRQGYVPEHRLVVAARLGRPLDSTEHVHHIDRNPANNAPENLQLLSRSAHQSLHAKEQGHAVNRSGTHLWCPGCQRVKATNDFFRDRSRPTGHQGLCKICQNERRRAWRRRKREAA